jgi:serine/threonine-protein kinase
VAGTPEPGWLDIVLPDLRTGASAGAELADGEMFAGHRITCRLGSGGWGVVYQAYDPQLRRDVAVKVMRRDVAVHPVYGKAFQRESRTLASVEHPHVLPVFRAGVADERPFLLTRLARGGSLRTRLREGARLAPGHALHVLGQVADALDAVHARGLVHRDVKPENILLEGAPGGEYAWLGDFGLAWHFGGSVVMSGAGYGTTGYMAPEQRRSGADVGPPADVYALALVLHEALAGRLPTPAERWPFRPAAELGEPVRLLGEVLDRALAPNPDDRYVTAGQLVEQARAALRPGRHSAVPRPRTPTDGPHPAATGRHAATDRRPPTTAGTVRPVGRATPRATGRATPPPPAGCAAPPVTGRAAPGYPATAPGPPATAPGHPAAAPGHPAAAPVPPRPVARPAEPEPGVVDPARVQPVPAHQRAPSRHRQPLPRPGGRTKSLAAAAVVVVVAVATAGAVGLVRPTSGGPAVAQGSHGPQPTPAASPTLLVVCADTLELRKDPAPGNPTVVAKLRRGDTFEVVRDPSDPQWLYGRGPGDAQGWIFLWDPQWLKPHC